MYQAYVSLIKVLVISIVFSFSILSNAFAQSVNYIAPKNSNRWTGYVESNGDIHSDVIWVGKPTIGNACRGFISFDLTGEFESNTDIQSITLSLYPYNPAGNNHYLTIRNLYFNPVTANGLDLWDDISTGTSYYSGDGYVLANVEDDWVDIDLNEDACNNLESIIAAGTQTYWAIGLREVLDDDNTPHIYGYSSSYRPYCTITYILKSIAPTGANATPSTICSSNSVTLTRIGGTLGTGAYWGWYSGSCGGTYIGTGSSITVNPTTTTTYYVRAEGESNTTSCASVTVTVKSNSTAPSSASATPNPVCSGSTVTMSRSGGSLGTGATWEWYSGSCGGTYVGSGSSITVSPTSTRTYYVRAEGDCNTTSCANVTVTVISPSTAPTDITASASSVCSGGSVTLTKSGGTLGTGASWEWYRGSCGGTYIGTGTSITVNPTSTTTYYVRAEGDCNNTSCASRTITVTPNASIGSISGTTPLCTGNSATYTANTVELGGGTGSWSSTNTSVATVNPSSGLVTAIGQGSSSITYTITGGCGGTVSKYQQLTVNSDNTITLTSGSGTDNQTVCINTDIQIIRYSTTSATGATFTGLPDGVSGSWAANVITISGSPSQSGTFNYSVSLTGGCGNVSAPGTIIVNPENTIILTSASGTNDQSACINSPVTNIRYSTTGAEGDVFSGLPPGVTGTWENNIITISGSPSQTGTFNYTVTLSGGCGDVTASGKIIVNDNNTISLASPQGTDNQSVCINTTITEIRYSTTGATGATFTGLPPGVTGSWSANTISINGIPTSAGTYKYKITLSGGCGNITKEGTITVLPNNTITLTSGSGTNNKYACINNAITPITWSTTGATSAIFTGLPAGVTGKWLADVVTISGTPTVFGQYDYTVSLTGGCGDIKATGKITVNPDNTITMTSAPGTDDQTLCINTNLTTITYSTTGATGAEFSGLPPGVTGNWSVNQITISGIPIQSGTFYYTITLTGGCGVIISTGKITVLPANTISLPSPAGSDNQSVCMNSEMQQITYSTTGAEDANITGLPDGVNGDWNSDRVTINGTPTENGTFNYTVTLTGGCGNIEAKGTIKVNLNNTITLTSSSGTDNQSVCINSAINSIKYSTTVATGADFSGLPPGITGTWALNTISISGIPSASSTYNYSISLTGGCGDIDTTGKITVRPRPLITSFADGFNCGPGSVNLQAVPEFGTTNWHLYQTGGSPVATGNTYVTPALASSRDYYADATADGCTTESRTIITATIYPVNIPPVVLKWEDVIICSNVNNLFTSYQWIKDDNIIPEATKQYYVTDKMPGTYKVRTIDINGCETTSNEITIGEAKSMTLYPNPAKGSFTIKLEIEILGKVKILLISETGVKVREINAEKPDPGFVYEIPAEDLDEGIYLIRLLINDIHIFNSKIVVLK